MSDIDVKVPTDRESERYLLGLLLQDAHGDHWETARHLCRVEDLYLPAHEEIWGAIARLREAGTKAIDALVVMTELSRAGVLNKVGGAPYLHDLVSLIGWADNIGTYARRIHDVARERRALQIHQRIGQALIEHSEGDHEELLTKLASEALALDLLVDERGMDQPLDGFMSWEALWQIYPSETPDWLIPDLLLAEDVWMLLGGEGGGKSFFSRQFCLTLAAGIHPFHADRRITPVRTLLVDLENAPAMVAWESRAIGTKVQMLGDYDPDLARVWMKEDGINLRDRKDAMLLERAIEAHRPQLVALGSLYKAFRRGKDDWETAAEETREVLDRLRRRYHCAFLIEHHMPKASGGTDRPMNPYGSSVWQRWPSIGQTINRVGENMYELVPFRGTRLERQMPKALYRGGQLPWSPVWDQTEVEFGMDEDIRAARQKHGNRR